MKAADLARVMENVRKERNRAYEEWIDAPTHPKNEFEQVSARALGIRYEHLREEFKTLRAAHDRAVEAEEKEALEAGKQEAAGHPGSAANS